MHDAGVETALVQELERFAHLGGERAVERRDRRIDQPCHSLVALVGVDDVQHLLPGGVPAEVVDEDLERAVHAGR